MYGVRRTHPYSGYSSGAPSITAVHVYLLDEDSQVQSSAFRLIGGQVESLLEGAGDLVSRVISALNGVTLVNPTYNQLTKPPAPSSRVVNPLTQRLTKYGFFMPRNDALN